MSIYRNPDPPAASFWVVIAAIWLPLLALFFCAGEAVPVGKLILLGLVFNAVVLLALAYLHPSARPDAVERRRLAFFGFQWALDFTAGLGCVLVAAAVAMLLILVLPRAWNSEWWIRELLLVVSGLLFPFVRVWLERCLLALLARFSKDRADVA